jgi:hypothetical protein
MDEAIRIDDRDNGETVIKIREAFWSVAQSSNGQGFLVLFLIVTFPFFPFTLLMIILLLFIPNLFCRTLIVTITSTGKGFCQISTKSSFQIAGCEISLVDQAKTYDFTAGASLAYERGGKNNAGDFIITIPCVDGEKMRIWVNAYPVTVETIINKILSPEKSESVVKSEIREDTVLDGENDYSLSITALLSAIDPENFSTLVKDNQLVVNNKKSYDCNTFGILLGGIGYTVIGFSGIFVSSSGLDIRFNIGFLAYLVFIFSTALMFRGVHSMVKRFIAEPIYQTVCFDNISQVITLEEQFPIYKSTQKYFWEKAELSITKPQNAEDYLKDKKVLVVTLQKSGQPATRVELFKHQKNEYLEKLRDYIMEFMDNLGQNSYA